MVEAFLKNVTIHAFLSLIMLLTFQELRSVKILLLLKNNENQKKIFFEA